MSDYLNFFNYGLFNCIPNTLTDVRNTIESLSNKGTKLTTNKSKVNYIISILKKEILPYEHISNKVSYIGGANVCRPYVVKPRDRFGYFVDKSKGKTKIINTYATRFIYYFPRGILSAFEALTGLKEANTEQLQLFTWFIIGHERTHTTQKILSGFLISPRAQDRYECFASCSPKFTMEERHAYWHGWAFAKRRRAGVTTIY